MKSQAFETGFTSKPFIHDAGYIYGSESPADEPRNLAIPRVSARTLFYRRLFDITFSGALLLLLLPAAILISLIIILDSPGPILFRQNRVGAGGTLFLFYKFRSMVMDAEARRPELDSLNEATGPLFKIKQDPRITRCGRWMRKYSIDELPQLINVLIGNMSVLGPRPALPAEVGQYNQIQRQRLCIKPGITGLWQVSGRSDLTFEQSIKLDIEYINQQSLWLDFTILLRTVGAVVKGRGAY